MPSAKVKEFSVCKKVSCYSEITSCAEVLFKVFVFRFGNGLNFSLGIANIGVGGGGFVGGEFRLSRLECYIIGCHKFIINANYCIVNY